ncbi:thiamine diphosphate-binding protein [Lactarius sanguifluus]|nr:thiamine diphosphate-binding protein [Lactarius sanguifluus]
MSAPLDKFPIDLSKYKKLKLDASNPRLTDEQRQTLKHNIQLLRDAIVLFTSTGAARGVSGHTGHHPTSITQSSSMRLVSHRVATQYLLSALDGHIPAEHLLQYRAAESKLPGHPELGLTPGVKFSSGRLGHMWPMVNGVALANRDKTAARLAVAQSLNVKLIIDDNNVTIAGYPSEYLKGYELPKTLAGHGLEVITVQGEDIDALWGAFVKAVVAKRVMAPGVPDIEGSNHGHDVIPVKGALSYFKRRGYPDEKYNEIENILLNIKPSAVPYLYVGSTRENNANRVVFGEAVSAVLDGLSKEEAAKKVMVIDSDLEGSTGLKVIHQKHPEVFVPSGVMERGNFSAAAGFGFESRQMVVSEVTMARLNNCNVLCHFSHSGVDEIADNTCHFGINSFFADNGLDDVHSWLYFPADALQMRAIIKRVFFERGLRFVFSTRAKVPFVPGKDEVVLEGKDGYVVSYGDMLYRSYDAVLRVRQEGLDVGLINKPTLNLVDEQVSVDSDVNQQSRRSDRARFVLVVESLSRKTGLGSRFGTWLLERQLTPKYGYLGTHKEGCGGLQEQITFQGLDPQSIIAKIKTLSN